MKRIPYGRQSITDDDIQAVVDVLKSDYLTQGPAIAEFEKAFAEYTGSKYAVAVSNGTAALHLSVIAMDVKPGDKVITTPLTFVATANAVGYCGGEAIFSDINPETWLLDIEKVSNLLMASPMGTYKGIIPVDFAGNPVDMEKLRSLADEYGLWIIEDASHAPGGYFTSQNGQKQQCGNGRFSDLAIFSFHPVKHITTGEGGMITTNDVKLYHRLRNLRSHGIQQQPELKQFNHGVWYYEMQELGYNYRMTDIQAALGSSQLKRANAGLERRKEIASTYQKAFYKKKYIRHLPAIPEGHALHLFVAEFEDRDRLIGHLRENNIIAQVHYIPVHLMPYYRALGWKEGDMPCAENYYRYGLSLPIFPSLKEVELEQVINTIEEFYG
jgi:UDP-4-amino-4,6-dideoxy-N-acetyl-beta-L-altrosamine transaminase